MAEKAGRGTSAHQLILSPEYNVHYRKNSLLQQAFLLEESVSWERSTTKDEKFHPILGPLWALGFGTDTNIHNSTVRGPTDQNRLVELFVLEHFSIEKRRLIFFL